MVYQNIEVDIIKEVDKRIKADPSLPPFQQREKYFCPAKKLLKYYNSLNGGEDTILIQHLNPFRISYIKVVQYTLRIVCKHTGRHRDKLMLNF